MRFGVDLALALRCCMVASANSLAVFLVGVIVGLLMSLSSLLLPFPPLSDGKHFVMLESRDEAMLL